VNYKGIKDTSITGKKRFFITFSGKHVCC